MELGVQIGYLGGPLADMRRLWRFADDAGFDWFSVADHLRESPMRGAGHPPCFEALTILTYAASETSRVRLGTLVSPVGFRNVGLMAKAFTAIDHISHGRVECGVGAGGFAAEHEGYGLSFSASRERTEMLDEYVQGLRQLFDCDRADLHGVHVRLEDAQNYPKPIQSRLPICVGGTGESRTLPIVARRADVWNAPHLTPQEFSQKNKVLDDLTDRYGREAREIKRTLLVGFYMGSDASGVRAGEALYRQQWGDSAVEDLEQGSAIRGTVDDAIRKVHHYADVGVDRLILAVRQGPYDWAALEAFADKVLPEFRSAR
jgi:alkanesulfonate monooxygenase SsuD/methylene tetrahydromethanopterin reductase-like flavin-dependent oxidoreductase (luciferase family)